MTIIAIIIITDTFIITMQTANSNCENTHNTSREGS